MLLPMNANCRTPLIFLPWKQNYMPILQSLFSQWLIPQTIGVLCDIVCRIVSRGMLMRFNLAFAHHNFLSSTVPHLEGRTKMLMIMNLNCATSLAFVPWKRNYLPLLNYSANGTFTLTFMLFVVACLVLFQFPWDFLWLMQQLRWTSLA